jgi:hypothetical protein
MKEEFDMDLQKDEISELGDGLVQYFEVLSKNIGKLNNNDYDTNINSNKPEK